MNADVNDTSTQIDDSSEGTRFNIYENGKLIGQDYKSGNGNWMHKWAIKGLEFERGGWTGKAKGDRSENWEYVEVQD